MEKVIVYGVGAYFEEHREEIEANYHIIGYCDTDEGKLERLEKAVKIEELKRKDYNSILVTTSIYAGEVIESLLSHGVEEKKIKVLPYEEFMHGIGGVAPKKTSWSGGWEDLIIDEIVRKLKINYNEMKYIELGVLSPVTGSNTFYFYQRGATGILVEANPGLIRNIKKFRSADKVINKAVYAGSEREVSFYISECAGLSSVKPDWVEQGGEGWKKYGRKETIQIPTIHINDVFAMLERKCNLLSMDIEGYDYEAINSLDFRKYRPQIIILELLSGRCDTPKIVKLLLEKGYMLYACNSANGIFVDRCYENQL